MTVSGTATPTASEADGVAAYDGFLKEQLTAQEARKASFESRGLAVVTTAGTLVTLLFGLAAFASGGPNPKLTGEAKTWLAVALVVFIASAVLALATNLPFFYDAPAADAFKHRVKADQFKATSAARRDIALTRANMLHNWKRTNSVKGWLLTAALTLEVVAIGFVGIAIFEIID
jgi:hypothetical protein